GAASLSSATAQTDIGGNASVNLQINSFSSRIQVSVCIAPNNNPCQTLTANVAPLSSLQLRPVSGSFQVVPAGQTLQSVVVRVTDSSTPPNPVLGASVLFLSYVGRTAQNQPIAWAGEAGISQQSLAVIVAKSQATVQSDINGLVSFPLSTGGFSGNVVVAG